MKEINNLIWGKGAPLPRYARLDTHARPPRGVGFFGVSALVHFGAQRSAPLRIVSAY